MKTTSSELVTEPVGYGPNTGPLPECLPEMIRRRAYQIFECRGSEPGHELDDWLQVEREIKTHLRLTNNKRPEAQAIRAKLSKPRLAVTRSTQFNANGWLTDCSQQRHVTHSLLSLSGFRRLRPCECEVGTIIAPGTKVTIVFETIFKTYEQEHSTEPIRPIISTT
jgi:Protein of unknown function (DUF2934)